MNGICFVQFCRKRLLSSLNLSQFTRISTQKRIKPFILRNNNKIIPSTKTWLTGFRNKFDILMSRKRHECYTPQSLFTSVINFNKTETM